MARPKSPIMLFGARTTAPEKRSRSGASKIGRGFRLRRFSSARAAARDGYIRHVVTYSEKGIASVMQSSDQLPNRVWNAAFL